MTRRRERMSTGNARRTLTDASRGAPIDKRDMERAKATAADHYAAAADAAQRYRDRSDTE